MAPGPSSYSLRDSDSLSEDGNDSRVPYPHPSPPSTPGPSSHPSSDLDSSSEDEDNSGDSRGNPQALSIQWLSIEKITGTKVLKLNGSRPAMDLGNEIEKLVDKYNTAERQKKFDQKKLTKKKEEKVNVFEKQTVDDKDNFKYAPYKLQKYMMVSKIMTCLHGEVADNPTENVSSQHILFYYCTEPSPIIFALTNDKAFRVVKKYLDHSFPAKVAAKIGNPKKVLYLEKRPLFGELIKTMNYMDRRSEPGCTSSLDLYNLIETYRCEIKSKSSLAKELRKIKEPPKDSPLLVESTSMTTRGNSSKSTSVIITVRTSGILRIERKIALNDYPCVLNLLVAYMQDEETRNEEDMEEEDDPQFVHLHYLHPADPNYTQWLNRSLIREIFRQYQGGRAEFCVRHKYIHDFLHANEFEYKINNSTMRFFRYLDSRPPMLKNILEVIIKDEEKSDEEKFASIFSNTVLRFSKDDEKKDTAVVESLINYVEGELSIDSNWYFKLRNMWYNISTDYIVHLNRNLKNLLKTSLIDDKNSEAFLPRPWYKGEHEGPYNEAYLEPDHYGRENGYLVFDSMFDKTHNPPSMEIIEFCDILKLTEETVYLYHVKETFGREVRVVTSQLLNSAKLLRSSISLEQPENYLQRLWAYVVRQLEQGEEHNETKAKAKARGKKANADDEAKAEKTEAAAKIHKAKAEAIVKCFRTEAEFLNTFGSKKIVFVYAYRPSDPEKTLSNYIKQYSRVTPDTFTTFAPEKRKMLFRELVTRGFLDLSGELTGKFCNCAEDQFTLGGEFGQQSREIFEWLAPFRPLSASTIASLELVRASKDIKDLNFDFKICEITPVKFSKEGIRIKTESSDVDKGSPKKERKRKGNLPDANENSQKKKRRKEQVDDSGVIPMDTLNITQKRARTDPSETGSSSTPAPDIPPKSSRKRTKQLNETVDSLHQIHSSGNESSSHDLPSIKSTDLDKESSLIYNLAPASSLFDDDVNLPISFQDLAEFLQSCQKTKKAPNIAKKYTQDIPALIILLEKCHEVIQNRNLKSRITRIKNALLPK